MLRHKKAVRCKSVLQKLNFSKRPFLSTHTKLLVLQKKEKNERASNFPISESAENTKNCNVES